MSKIVDLTNQKIGNLKVLYLDNNWYKDGRKHWICQCDCGNICSISSSVLRDKKRKTYSCGCQNKIEDLTNKVFGEWIVLKQDTNHNREIYWICQCSCGNIKSVSGKSLKDSRSQSCGCKKQSHGEKKIFDILKQNNILFEQQKIFKNCFNESSLRFDFYLPDYNTCIEYDGEQHFQSIPLWGGTEALEKQQLNDNIKNNFCFTNNIFLIRIPYTHFNNITINDLLPTSSSFVINN